MLLCSWRSSKPATEGGGFPAPCHTYSATAFGCMSCGGTLEGWFQEKPWFQVLHVLGLVLHQEDAHFSHLGAKGFLVAVA